MKNRQYIIPEDLLDKIKVLLQRQRYMLPKETDELFLLLNYVKEAPKECKCP